MMILSFKEWRFYFQLTLRGENYLSQLSKLEIIAETTQNHILRIKTKQMWMFLKTKMDQKLVLGSK